MRTNNEYTYDEIAAYKALRAAGASGRTAVKVSARRKKALAAKRKKQARMRSSVIAACSIIVISAAILLGTTHTFADNARETPLYKYYTNVEVESGDTLWDLADEYMAGSDMSKKEYVNQLIKVNGLSSDGTIHAGQNLIVIYYSDEMK